LSKARDHYTRTNSALKPIVPRSTAHQLTESEA
jgi:hypothetical protein